MKIAVIGNGKTGYEVEKVLPRNQVVGPFNSTYPVSVSKVSEADVGIVFVAPQAFGDITEALVETGIPMVIGTTGVHWSPELKKTLEEKGITWVYGANFSLGMQMTRTLLNQASFLLKAFPQFTPKIHEVHHVNKQDAPSGTALMWNNMIGEAAEITHERKGDVKGFHQLILSSGDEKVELQHEAFNRKIFAEGAIWCARYLTKQKTQAGLINFNDIVDTYLKNMEMQNGNLNFRNESMDSNRDTNERAGRDSL